MIAYSQHPTQSLRIVTLCIDEYGPLGEEE
jgi:hypothetical protein